MMEHHWDDAKAPIGFRRVARLKECITCQFVFGVKINIKDETSLIMGFDVRQVSTSLEFLLEQTFILGSDLLL